MPRINWMRGRRGAWLGATPGGDLLFTIRPCPPKLGYALDAAFWSERLNGFQTVREIRTALTPWGARSQARHLVGEL